MIVRIDKSFDKDVSKIKDKSFLLKLLLSDASIEKIFTTTFPESAIPDWCCAFSFSLINPKAWSILIPRHSKTH